MAYGLTPQDAIPILSDSEDEPMNLDNDHHNDSSSDDEEGLGFTLKKEPGSNGASSSNHGSFRTGAQHGLPIAPVFNLQPDREPEDWQRASYIASQRAYADIARYFRSGDAYFISLSLTPWEGAKGKATDILDFGWAHLTEAFGYDRSRSRDGFDWKQALQDASHGRFGMKTTKTEWDAADRVFSAFKRAKARVTWKPKVVHCLPKEAMDRFNRTYYPDNKINFLFRPFAERVNPYWRNSAFHRQIDGTHVDEQDYGIHEFNRQLGDLSSKKPVFLLTHCMEQDVNFLSNLGIAWQNMNLSYPLSPWFAPEEDAEWLRDHAYWRFAWDFALPPPRQNGTASNGASRSSNRENDKMDRNGTLRPNQAGTGAGHQTSSEDDDDDRPIDPRIKRRPSPVFERARFTGGGPGRTNGHSSDESDSWHRRVPAPRRSFSPTPAPKKPRLLTRHEFYKPGTIHLVDIYALMEVMPKFSERSASYYPANGRGEQGSTAEDRQRIAQQKKEELEKYRADLLKRATAMMNRCAGSNEERRKIWGKSLQAAAFRTGMLNEEDGTGDQFKWWHGGNDATYILAILANLIGEHPLPDRAPTPPPPELPPKPTTSSTRFLGSGLLRPPSQQRAKRVEVAATSNRNDVRRDESRARTSATQSFSSSTSSSSRLPASLPQRPALSQGLRRNAPTDAVEVPITPASEIRASMTSRRLQPPSAQAAVRAQQEEQRRRAEEAQRALEIPDVELMEPCQQSTTAGSQSAATKRARPEPAVSVDVRTTTQQRSRARTAAVLASNRIGNLPSAVRNGVPLSDSFESSDLSSIDEDEDIGPRRKHQRIVDSPTPEPEVLDSRHQFKPFYKYLHQLFEEPAIYISFAYRNAAPHSEFDISEVGICVLDASRADARESLQLNTSHLLVKEFLKWARPEAKTDFRYARGTDSIKIDKSEALSSGTRIAKKAHITKAIHEVLSRALATERRVFVVLSMLDNEVQHAHHSMVGPDMWPVFYDWRTLHLNALGKDNEQMFLSSKLWNHMKTMVSSGSVPGTRGRKIFTIEVGSLFAAVNPDDNPAGPGGADDDGRTEKFTNIPFPQICDLLGIQPEADRGLDNAGNAAYFTMQAMLEFAYGPADLELLKKEVKSRKDAQDIRAVEAQI